MTKIEWTDETWNPIIGCSKISEGCENCYAEKMAGRLSNMKHSHDKYCKVVDIGVKDDMYYGKQKWNGHTTFEISDLQIPSKWKKPRRIFVCSMGDLFHESVPFAWINAVFSVMSDCDWHTYQVLTKRPQRMKEFFEWKSNNHQIKWVPKPNIWIGVTVENQQRANERIPVLLEIPAAIHFISVEPMLGPIDFRPITMGKFIQFIKSNETSYPLNWVICGGETGHKARPMHPEWVYNLQKQCEEINLPFFFKSWGNKVQISSDEKYSQVLKVKNLPAEIHHKEYKQFPKTIQL